MQHALVMFFTCFNELCSHIGIKDRLLGKVNPLYIGDKEAILKLLAVVAALVHPLGVATCMSHACNSHIE